MLDFPLIMIARNKLGKPKGEEAMTVGRGRGWRQAREREWEGGTCACAGARDGGEEAMAGTMWERKRGRSAAGLLWRARWGRGSERVRPRGEWWEEAACDGGGPAAAAKGCLRSDG
ncbi:hypothetical protein DAI22_12g055700 [Oryza sativa Japonica Group]|nr:hypothetical protein DAI22_12g055700 [Oryza sativa Japonica Group]